MWPSKATIRAYWNEGVPCDIGSDHDSLCVDSNVFEECWNPLFHNIVCQVSAVLCIRYASCWKLPVTWIFRRYCSWGLMRLPSRTHSDILTCICLMAGGLLVRRDVRMSHDVTSDRHTTWRQTVTRRKRFVKWLLNAITHNAHPAARMSQYDNSHPVPIRCFWILLEFRNTIVRVQSRVIRDMIFGR